MKNKRKNEIELDIVKKKNRSQSNLDKLPELENR